MASLVSEVNTNSPCSPSVDHPAAHRVHDLGDEMIFPDRRAILGVREFLGDAGPHDLRQSVDVAGVDVERGFDFRAHAVAPGLGAEDADAQRRRARVDALPLEFIENGEHVARRHHDDVGRKIADQLHLPFGLAARHRNHRASRRFGAVVRAQSAGEQAVAVGDVHLHAGAAAGGPNRARDQIAPGGQIVARIADDRGLAGRARGGVNPRDLFPGHGEKAEGIRVAQIRLGRERESGQIGERAQVIRLDARRVEFPPVVGIVCVGVTQRRLQARRAAGIRARRGRRRE